MTKIFTFFLFLTFLGCTGIIKNKQTFIDFSCPRVFFSSEDRIYIDNSKSLDHITFKAEINNFAINKKCQQKENIAIIPLDILIVVNPMNNSNDSLLSLPVFISLLDVNDKILETQYFFVTGSINKNNENKNLTETDITDRLRIITKNLNTSQLVIGFMLDEKKRNLLD